MKKAIGLFLCLCLVLALVGTVLGFVMSRGQMSRYQR